MRRAARKVLPADTARAAEAAGARLTIEEAIAYARTDVWIDRAKPVPPPVLSKREREVPVHAGRSRDPPAGRDGHTRDPWSEPECAARDESAPRHVALRPDRETAHERRSRDHVAHERRSDIGPIEVVVYNLGAQIGDRALKDTSPKAFETGWRLGTFGLFRLASAVCPLMEARGKGTILVTSSTAAMRGNAGQHSHAAAMGAAVLKRPGN